MLFKGKVFPVNFATLEAWAYSHLLPGILAIFIRLICISLRVRWIGDEPMRKLRTIREPVVFAFWHGRHFMLIHSFRWRKIAARLGRWKFRRISIMTSTSRDGRLLADILKKFGYGNIPGSSHKSPVRALLLAVQKIRHGDDLAFAVDGPTGPLHRVKPGALFVAKKAEAWIIPLTFSSRSAWTFRSWDRFMLPRPFAKILLLVGEPYKPSQDFSETEVESERLMLEATLERLTEEADRMARS